MVRYMNQINYPNHIKKDLPVVSKTKSYNRKKANLGSDFEKKLNDTNLYYLQKGVAAIYKKPTPIQVVKVDYPSRNKARISEAYYKTPSTTDYNGIYRGYYIDFEAKCCHGTSFAFSHIFDHQIEHLANVSKLGGIAFLIIEFPNKNEVFVLPIDILLKKFELSKNGGRKSISYQEFKDEGYLVKEEYSPSIPYLKYIDIMIDNLESKK